MTASTPVCHGYPAGYWAETKRISRRRKGRRMSCAVSQDDRVFPPGIIGVLKIKRKAMQVSGALVRVKSSAAACTSFE